MIHSARPHGPNSRDHYSFLKFVLLCEILKRADGQTYRHYVQKHWSLPAVTVDGLVDQLNEIENTLLHRDTKAAFF